MASKNFVVKNGLTAGNLVIDASTGSINTDATGATTTKVNLGVITGSTGSLKVPTGTAAQQDGTPAAGYLRFNTDTSSFEGYTGSAWGSIGGSGGATGGSSDDVFYENSQSVTASYTITAGKSAMSTGPITVDSGAVVTVPSGSRWVVL